MELSRRVPLPAVAVAGLAAGLCIAALGLTSDHLELAGVVLPLLLFVGWSFIGVGIYAWWRRPDNAFGALMVLAGFAWFVAGLQVSDIPLLFTIGVWLGVLYVATIVHLLLAFPSGRLVSESDRGLTIAAYFVTTVVLLPAVFVLDLDSQGCEGCPRNLFLISESATAYDAIDIATSLLGMLLAFAVVRSLLRRWRASGPRLRRALTPVLAAGGIATLGLGVNLVFDVVGVEPVAEVAGLAGLVGIAAVPWCFLIGLARSAVTRGGAVADLVSELGAAARPDQVRRALARALADPALELAYWIPDAGRHVDEDGHEVELPQDGERDVTPVELEGRRVAAIVHDSGLRDEPEFVRAVADSAALALERSRLDAELRAKVEELRASRARIVEAGYAAARRLERDLHDGAQQRLVSLALALALVEAKIENDPAEAARLLGASREELGHAIDELRDFARGLHPGILSTRGLDAAVEALAARAPLPVEVRGRVGERLPQQVEAAAYYLVSEALTNVARYADAESAWVGLARRNGVLDVEVGDDGRGGADAAGGSGLRGLRDRVAALDGGLEVESPPGAGTRVRAHIPCSWAPQRS